MTLAEVFVTKRSMKKLQFALYVSLIVAMMTAGIFLVLKFGMKPQPVGVMKPSFFSGPEEIGAVVYRRFYVDIDAKKLVVFGVPPQPDWNLAVVRGFVREAQALQRPFDALIAESAMPPLDLTGLPPLETTSVEMNALTQSDLIDKLNAYRAAGKRVLLYTASVFSTRLLQGNPINRLEKATGESYFTITGAPLALHPDQEFLVDPPCLGSERDMRGTADLGCAVLMAGRRFYRKHIDQSRFVAIMQKQGAVEDYLLMISSPGQDKSAKTGQR